MTFHTKDKKGHSLANMLKFFPIVPDQILKFLYCPGGPTLTNTLLPLRGFNGFQQLVPISCLIQGDRSGVKK